MKPLLLAVALLALLWLRRRPGRSVSDGRPKRRVERIPWPSYSGNGNPGGLRVGVMYRSLPIPPDMDEPVYEGWPW